MELKIYDKQGIVKMTVSPDNSSQWNHEVGVENVVTVNFTTWEFLVLKVGWYILVEGQRFSIKSEYRPKHIHETKYTYNLKFYGREHDAQDILFCRLNQGEDDLESVFAYDGTPMDFLQKVVANMNRNTDGVEWKAGEAISANRQTINFNGLYCWDALGEIARAFGTEWWMDGEYLNISKCERGESVSLGYGQGLKSGLTQNENTNSVKWFTRLIPVGSSKNIDKNKYGYATLQLPGREKYIDINTQYGLKEYREEAAFSEIYPHRVGAISSVRSEERTNEETGNYTVYYVKDSSLPFNPDEYMIGGEVIHMTFNSGALAGKDFEVNWNNETKEFEIINQYPDENTQLPAGNLVPSAEDTYVLWNISMPDEYIRAAEQELKTAVDVYLAEYSKDISVYSGSTDYIYISKNDVPLLLGQRVRLLSDVYFGNIGRDSRITRVSRKLNNLNEATIDCSDAIASSWKSSVDSSLNQLQFAVSNEMAQALIQILKTGEPGTPSDYNVLSALRSLNTFLRKDKDDTAKGNITFEKNIGSTDFVKGNLMGSGWSIYKDANGNTVVETDTIIARKSINASELVVNQETFEKGSNIFVKGGCSITKVEEVNGRYRCFYDNENGKRFSGFKVGDQARCQRYDSSYGLKIKYYWRLVVGVADDYVELSMTDFDGVGVPEEGDDIAQLGNRSDKTRQSAIVISPDNGGSVVVWAGIDSYNLSERNMCGMGVNPNNGRAYIYGYGDMFFGDRNLEKNYITYQTREGDTEPTLNINADIHFGKGSDGLSNLSEFKDIQNEVDNLFGQIEREFTIWYYDYEPTLDNEPAVNWNTDELKAMHDQDLYFSDALARAWRFVNGNWVEVTDERTLAALKLADEAQKAATEAKNYINNVLPKQLEELQNQIDGAIESFFYKYDPTTSNEPASLWSTEEQKAMHLNDTFTNLESGYSWRWTVNEGIYGWTEISDTATVKALVVAGQAQDTADQKRRVFVSTPYTPYDEGDLWVQGETGDILRCSNSRASGNFDSSDWVKASKYTDDSALETFLNGPYKEQLEAIQSQIDSRAETWYQSTDPSLQWTTDALKQQHVGDLWYDINKAQSFLWNGSEWVVQGVPDEVFDKIDGKAQIFVSRPNSYNRNDLWILEGDMTLDKDYKEGTIVIATTSSNYFKEAHWTKLDRYTDDSRADEAYGKAEEAYRKAESFSEDLSGVLADMEIVMNQVDREFTIWYYNHVPTLNNAPAVDWDTDEEKQRHDQDICFADELARAWRFVDGQWVEITDERTLAALKISEDAKSDAEDAKKNAEEAKKQANAAANRVANVEYLKDTFGKNETIIDGGVYISKLVSVKNEEENIEAFLNGSDVGKDAEHGKLILAGGIPDKTSDGHDDLQARSKEATTRVYEDGSAFFGNANISGSFNSGDGKTSFDKDGSGQLANGNIKWDSDGTMWKKSPEYIVWRRIEDEYEAGDTIDLQEGSYLDITVGLDFPEYALPSPETDKTIAVRYIHASRSDIPAMLGGNFNINGVETTRITIAGSGQSFELEYSTTTGKWHYYGYSGLGYYGEYGEVITLLDKEEESTTPSINGLTKTITIHGVYGEYELTFESGLLTGYKYNPTEGGN